MILRDRPTDPLDALLSGARSTVDNVGKWSARYEGVYIWIGEPGGSRVGQYEADVHYDDRSIELRSRSYDSLSRQIKTAFKKLRAGDEVTERQPLPRNNVLAQTDSRFRPARPDRPIAEASVKGSDGVVYAARMYPEAVGTYGTASNLTLYFKRDGREWREIGWDSIPKSSYAALRRELAASRERLRGRVP